MATSRSTPTTAPDARLRVAVGLLRASDGRVLVAERAAWRHAGGGLEFPGGKIEPEESAAQALARELTEELGIDVQESRPFLRIRHDYADRAVELAVREIIAWGGAATGCEGQALYWREPRELTPEQFPAANAPIVAALREPSRLRVTALDQPLAEQAAAVAAAANGGDSVQVRRPDLDAADWRELVGAIQRGIAAEAGGRVFLNTSADDPLCTETGFGLHLNAARAGSLASRPAGIGRLSCSAHTPDEFATAERLGVEFAVVGPVRPTASHPGASGIGWQGLADCAAATTRPIYAIGGLQPDDLAEARDHGAIGVAGIRGFW